MVGRSVFVGIQHEESEEGAREADTELSKGKNNISNNIDLSYSENVIKDQFRCYG